MVIKKSWKKVLGHSEEAKIRIGESNKKTYANPALKKYMSDLQKGKHISPETEFKKGHNHGFKKGYLPWNKGIRMIKKNLDITEPYLTKVAHTNYTKNWQRENRKEVIRQLGGKCVKCGFSDPRALQIDHVNGGGIKELKNIRMGASAYYKKVITDKTGSYQLLCANCNWIKKYEKDEVSHLPRNI